MLLCPPKVPHGCGYTVSGLGATLLKERIIMPDGTAAEPSKFTMIHI